MPVSARRTLSLPSCREWSSILPTGSNINRDIIMIDKFSGKNRFLSNFWPAPIIYKGKKYYTVEHAYQASKTLDEDECEAIRLASTPGKAKRLGSKVTIQPDWDNIKYRIMKELVMLKFQIPELAEKLLATNGQILVEGNIWGDTYWGVCDGIGNNHLGEILMMVRGKL